MTYQYTFLKLGGAVLDCLVLSVLKDRGLTLNSIWQRIMMITFSLAYLLCKDCMVYDLIRIMHSSHLKQAINVCLKGIALLINIFFFQGSKIIFLLRTFIFQWEIQCHIPYN
jgi:hypothetical protein